VTSWSANTLERRAASAGFLSTALIVIDPVSGSASAVIRFAA